MVLIAKIWKAYLELPADEKQNWPPKNDIEELVLCVVYPSPPYLHTFFDKLIRELEPFLAFVEEQQVKRKKTAERVWNSLTDSDSGKEYRDRVHGAIRLFEVSLVVVVLYLLIELSPKEKHPQINDASHRVRVEVSHIKPTLLLESSNAFNKQDEKERTPDADLRQLTEEKKVHIIEELHRLQAEGVTDEEARQPQRSSRTSYKEAKERLQDPESDHQHKEEQTEIERLREVIRVMKEDKKAAEEMEERKREEKEMDRKERARQREDRARVEAEEQRRRERIRIAEEDEKQRVFDRRRALEQIEKEAKATRITRMESIMSEQDESGEESSSDATEEPAWKLAPPMFLPPGQYPVDVFRWYSPYVVPTNRSPPTTNHISGFNKATIDGGVNIGNVTNSDNTKSGNSGESSLHETLNVIADLRNFK